MNRSSLYSLLGGLLLLLVGLLLPILCMQFLPVIPDDSIAIIGGADIPLYRYVFCSWFGGLPLTLTLLGAAMLISSLLFCIFRKTTQAHCQMQTSVLSVAISAVGALGFYCLLTWGAIVAWDTMAAHPVTYPASTVIGFFSLLAALSLLILYIRERIKTPSVKGIILDVLYAALYFVPFFCIYGTLHMIIGKWV